VDIITYAIFGDCRLRGVGVVSGVILPFPIDLRCRPYNTPCNHVIVVASTLGYRSIMSYVVMNIFILKKCPNTGYNFNTYIYTDFYNC